MSIPRAASPAVVELKYNGERTLPENDHRIEEIKLLIVERDEIQARIDDIHRDIKGEEFESEVDKVWSES